jgi:hypothetical protein
MLPFLFSYCTSNSGDGSQKFTQSGDGAVKILLPSGWKKSSKGSLNDEADIEMENSFLGGYAIVISEWKEDFTDMDLPKYSEITRTSLTRPLKNIQTGPPKTISIGQNSGLQHEIKAQFDNLNLIYLHTAVETPKRYHQIVTWSTQSRWEKKEKIFQEITQSLTESEG